MKYLNLCILLIVSAVAHTQNVQTDASTYTPQQLIEDILIDSNCIDNVVVTNVVGGNFNNTDQSYGYFDATGTTFPFQRGVVLSTGRLANVEGPNTSLSDDNAPNWIGDADLEYELQEQNTLNATIIEFEFTAVADRISFRYIFASEEYQENNPNTCQYSDLFGFLIRPANQQQQYTNIAVVPNTFQPVKVTTVHPDIPNGCPAINETYFGSWNNNTAPINFNGQTAVLTATADVVPNETYHVKLVIADEQNYRYDSAVFLEAGSFELNTNLGPDRLIATNNPLCENETLTLDATQQGTNTYKWFKDGVELLTETNPTLTVVDAGVYNVEITLSNSCISYGDIVIEYTTNPIVSDTAIIECDPDANGLTTYNLTESYVTTAITNNNNALTVSNYYISNIDASLNSNPIAMPTAFNNTTSNQVVFARVENQHGCFSIAEITLQTSNATMVLPPTEVCDDVSNDGYATFNLTQIQQQIAPLVPTNSIITFYESLTDIFSLGTPLTNSYQNANPYNDTIYAEIILNNNCNTIIEIPLVVNSIPELLPDESVDYCLNSFPTTITLENGAINMPSNSTYTYLWSTGEVTPTIDVNSVGTYTVTVTNQNNCSNSRTITVVPSNIATIDDVLIEEASSNNTVTILVSGEGEYEYALNFGTFQDSNLFEHVAPGFHTVYVRDKNGCGVVEQVISVLGFPKFFTPNADGFNDTWQLYGVNSQFNQGASVTIFDRYGKLITAFNNNSIGWDGTLNGEPLPSNDYWFVVKLSNGKEYRGHFTLKR